MSELWRDYVTESHRVLTNTWRSLDTSQNNLPDGWELKAVGEVCENPQYGYTQSATDRPVGPKFLRITDIQEGLVDWDGVPYCECPEFVIGKYLLQPGDILFART